MRIIRFRADGRVCYGVLEGEVIRTLRGSPFGRELRFDGSRLMISEVRLLAPVLPTKIVCLGLNYRKHADEFRQEIPPVPLIFLKPPSAVIGPGDNIVLPRGYRRVDFEGELAAVIGRKAKNVPESDAYKHILGYTCLNDVTERHNQKADGQWTRAKGYDTFCPIGPWIETELYPENLLLETFLNGERRQSVRTADLIFGVPRLVSFISEIMTLLPGDVIATGTPSGVGPMKSEDIVEVSIEGIGKLRNFVVEAGK